MAPPLNNTYAKKLVNDELKRKVFQSYLDHMAKGKSKKSWWYEDDEITLTWQTMDAYIKNESDVFDPIQIECARSKGYNLWEQVVEDSAKGINKDANTASLQMLMRNKFQWDKEDQANKSSNATLVEKFLDKLDNMGSNDSTP